MDYRGNQVMAHRVPAFVNGSYKHHTHTCTGKSGKICTKYKESAGMLLLLWGPGPTTPISFCPPAATPPTPPFFGFFVLRIAVTNCLTCKKTLSFSCEIKKQDNGLLPE